MVAASKTSMQGTQVGVISDTHGLLRPEAIAALQGSDLILHAGDIGQPEVLEGLSTIAPVIAIRGNNDKGDWYPFPLPICRFRVHPYTPRLRNW